jgi:exoribonuclease-2
MENGGIQFNRRELTPRVTESDDIILESSADNTPARKLVSELMVCANEAAALYARANNFPMIFRAQEAPDVEPGSLGLDLPDGPARQYQQRSVLKRSTTDSIPEPHFGLAVQAYVHCTSPIRRVCDLINQKQLGSFLVSGQSPYSDDEIKKLINQVEANLSEAAEIQRERNRYWLFTYLKRQKCKEIDGIVIRTEGARPLAEIDITFSTLPFYPSGFSHGTQVSCKKRPGDKIRLKIERNDPRTLSLKLVEIG